MNVEPLNRPLFHLFTGYHRFGLVFTQVSIVTSETVELKDPKREVNQFNPIFKYLTFLVDFFQTVNFQSHSSRILNTLNVWFHQVLRFVIFK